MSKHSSGTWVGGLLQDPVMTDMYFGGESRPPRPPHTPVCLQTKPGCPVSCWCPDAPLYGFGFCRSAAPNMCCRRDLRMDRRCLRRKAIKRGARGARAPADEPDVCQMEAVRTFLSGTSEILIRRRATNTRPDRRCSGINEITALAAFSSLPLTKDSLLLISALISNLRPGGSDYGLKCVRGKLLPFTQR